jgi:broad specificity phosphatase PhoE
MIELYLVRHAESEGNINPFLINGQSNHLKLTKNGEAQAERLGKRFCDERITFDQIYSSTALRCMHTTQIICQQIAFPPHHIQYSDQIIELSQGLWEGKVRAEMYTPEVKAQLINLQQFFKAPEGESQKEVEDRMYDFIFGHIIHSAQDHQKIMIVSHGMAIKCFFRGIMDSSPLMTYKTTVCNTSITKFEYDVNEGWYLDRLNDTAHLIGTELLNG